MQSSRAPALDTPQMVSYAFIYMPNILKLMFINVTYLQDGNDKVLRFLHHLLPLLLPSSGPPIQGKVINKIISDFDYFMPFRQHAPSLINARNAIYTDLSRLASNDGVGFFNVLAFRGVFFGSPFARSDRFQWFESFHDWCLFREEGREEALKICPAKEEEYYVKKNCYGSSQTQRSLKLLQGYWKQRQSWNTIFNKPRTPTVEEVYGWLVSTENGASKFFNIGSLTALLICGDLIEAGIIPMPSSLELGKLIYKVGKGAKAAMIMLGLVNQGVEEEDFCKAFSTLDAHIENALDIDKKKTMGYNIVMLEHTLCKMKRLTTHKVSIEDILSEI
jgi:hypothetical protein